ncbi:MAG: RsiV family protein [Peptococcaceae bacterium]
MQTNKLLTLQDILGDDYVATASKIIHQQMQTRMAEDKSITYDDFGSIRSDIDFYINEAGNPVIVFDKYEVAPGFMGRPEFEITK